MYRVVKQAFRGDEGGFTLVELLVAVTILAVGILAVGQIMAVSSRHAVSGRTETIAVSLAREIQEKILSESVSQVPDMFNGVDTNSPGTITTPCIEWAQHLNDQLGTSGRGMIRVYDPTEDPELLNGMYSVLVEIYWRSRGDTLSFPLRFAITSLGNS